MWVLALKTLIADRGKLLTALVGVVFSVVLVNVQGGLFFGLIRKASLLVDQGNADIWVGHKRMNNVDFAHDVPRRLMQRIHSIEGVTWVEPYLVGHSIMTLPDGGFEDVLVIGCDPTSGLGSNAAAMGIGCDALRKSDGIVVDSYDAHKMGSPAVGDTREIGRRRARIVGFTHGILGFLVTPYVFTTFDRAAEFLGRQSTVASYFLVKVNDSEVPEEVCFRIRERLPDLEAFTRQQYATASVNYWLTRTGLGISFGAATALGLVVGLIIVAQTLYASVLDRLTEFGTLKAIGAQEWQVRTIILQQAVSLAVVGSAAGLLCVLIIQAAFSTPRAPISIPWYLSLASCLVVTAVCLVAALLPYLRVRTIDPAMILQS